MPYPLNNVQVTNTEYDEARTCVFQYAVNTCFIQLANSAVYVQFEQLQQGMRPGSGSFGVEEFFTPGITTVSRDFQFGKVRFRRATTTGDAPQVTCR